MSDDQTAVVEDEATDLEEVTVDDVLVEEVSIDGMCGVY
jgi:mycofactocin precursor